MERKKIADYRIQSLNYPTNVEQTKLICDRLWEKQA